MSYTWVIHELSVSYMVIHHGMFDLEEVSEKIKYGCVSGDKIWERVGKMFNSTPGDLKGKKSLMYFTVSRRHFFENM